MTPGKWQQSQTQKRIAALEQQSRDAAEKMGHSRRYALRSATPGERHIWPATPDQYAKRNAFVTGDLATWRAARTRRWHDAINLQPAIDALRATLRVLSRLVQLERTAPIINAQPPPLEQRPQVQTTAPAISK